MFRYISRGFINKLNLKSFVNRNISSYISSKKINNMPGTAVLQVVGCGSSGSPKVVYLFTDHTRYLFNCGEGTQRLAHEYKMKLSRLEHIFITSASWDNIGGLPGVSLTLQDIGVENITLHGPPGLDELFIATQKFAVLNTMDVKMADCSGSNTFSDSILSVKYVPLKRKANIPENSESDELKETTLKYGIDNEFYDHEYSGKRKVKQSDMQNLMKLPKKETFFSISYICRLKDRLGALDLQKCVDKGVKPGPLLGQLKNGQDVTLPDGTVVYSSDVKTPDEPGSVFIVLDVPDVEYLDALLENKEFQPHQTSTSTNQNDLPNVIVHFTPDFVMCNERYQAFMKLFPSSTKHLIINDNNDCYHSMAVHRSQQKLHLLNANMFPPINSYDKYISGNIDFHEEIEKIKINNDSNENVDGNNSNISNDNAKSNDNEQLIKAKTLTLYYLSPKRGLDRSQEVKINSREYVEEAYATNEFAEALKKFRSTVANIEKCDEDQKYPMVVFLGTGSCIPNKTRNTSGIMIHIDENHCILFDCGEGTFSQMRKFYGVNEINNVLRKLNTIYISHLHADHHIGLIKVLQGRKQALEKTSSSSSQESNQKLFLLAPKQIELWLQLYDRRFETINDIYELLPNQDFKRPEDTSDDSNIHTFLQKNGLSNLKTCYVRHCPNAFGIAMTTASGKKITYSGDTMPCETLVEIGFNSDILIHEATMEDDLYNEAIKKLHSTTGQAIEISKKMQARNTILTHFSQRYASIPRVSEETEKEFLTNNIGIAFDNMKINYGSLGILPYMYPPLKLMFSEHCEELEFRAEKRALKRNHSSTEKDPEKNVLRKNKYKVKNL